MNTDWNPAREARSHRARAGAYTRRAEREAYEADKAYQTALRYRGAAVLLTHQPWAWFEGYSPASLESAAATWEHVGDTWLRGSFYATEMAAQYRELAASWAGHAERSAS